MPEREERYKSWRALKKEIRSADPFDPKAAELQLELHKTLSEILTSPIATKAHAIHAIHVLNYLVLTCAPYEGPIRRALLHLAQFIQTL